MPDYQDLKTLIDSDLESPADNGGPVGEAASMKKFEDTVKKAGL